MQSLRLEAEANEIENLKNTLATEPNALFSGALRLITTYAMMRAANMAPVKHQLHPMKHMAWDQWNNWPGGAGTSLNDRQYAAVEAILKQPQLAGHCYCGEAIPYGGGVEREGHRVAPTGLFCSRACQLKHQLRVEEHRKRMQEKAAE
jgi:hypothetical protein